MCGIVGLLCSVTSSPFSSQKQASVLEAAKQLQAMKQIDHKSLTQALQVFSNWIDPLAGFSTSFSLGHQPTFREDLKFVASSLHRALRFIDQKKENAQSFQELEKWNHLGIQTQDLLWRLEEDILGIQEQLFTTFPAPWREEQKDMLRAYWEIEFALRGLHRLEIRGRDSGGLSVLVAFPDQASYNLFLESIQKGPHVDNWNKRQENPGFLNEGICGVNEANGSTPTLGFIYKVASEIGTIGQNVQEIRESLHNDPILRKALKTPSIRVNTLTHTRWASNGVINIPNCHPQGNDTKDMNAGDTRLFSSLNGDIDNFQELLKKYKKRTGKELHNNVTTDAKIIPLVIEEKYKQTNDLKEAFRLSLQEFTGSFVIALHHADHPDKMWIGIGGSGQALYIGIHPEAVYFASELYGVVEGTSSFLKLDGERQREPGNPNSSGQLMEIRREDIGSERPFKAWSFDGVELGEEHLPIQKAQITTRDIDIAGFSHFFIKEITESVQSVHKTLYGRFFVQDDPKQPFLFNLDDSAVPEEIIRDLKSGKIKQIFCIGQGTAAVAAMGAANSLERTVDSSLIIRAMKATELSGHYLKENMEDSLTIAVSQSGTTTDTNRTVDLLRQRGARVIAILNRRNSDLAFKADGVMFTSDGRDVEMSVASTKAFYSQVTAGALLALYLGHRTGNLNTTEVHQGLKELQALPEKMELVLQQSEKVREVASKYALQKRYWAVVGSGHNNITAQEIRIKLSELCYKSMSCDFIEDKKHIDLSAEPLMIVCAAGLDEVNLGDSVKEVAIFKAHSSVPIVIADHGAEKFEPYAAAVFKVPTVPSHLSPIMTTMIGHLFGYHAACAIDEQALAMRQVRQSVRKALPALEKHPEEILAPHKASELRNQLLNLLQALQSPNFNSTLEVETAVRTTFLAQRLLNTAYQQQVQDDLPDSESPFEIAQRLMQTLTDSIQELTRPIDAIKHQAKTVTVGISRPSPKLKGVFGDVFTKLQLNTNLVRWRNLTYLIAAESLVSKVVGSVLYDVENLDFENQPTRKTRIQKKEALGVAADMKSRTVKDQILRGSKWLAVKNNDVQIRVGQNDGRRIAIIPLKSSEPRKARILLLHLEYNDSASLEQRIQLLQTRGAVSDRFRASVTEIDQVWEDNLLLKVPVETLFDETPDRFIKALTKAS